MGPTYLTLYIYVTVVYFGLFVGLLTMRAGSVPNALAGLRNLFPIQDEVLSLIATWYAMLCCYLWEACPFMNRSRGGVDLGRVEKRYGANGRRRGRRNCSQDIKLINELKSDCLFFISQTPSWNHFAQVFNDCIHTASDYDYLFIYFFIIVCECSIY